MILGFQATLPTESTPGLISSITLEFTPAELEVMGGDEFLRIVQEAPKDPRVYLRALAEVASKIKEVLPIT